MVNILYAAGILLKLLTSPAIFLTRPHRLGWYGVLGVYLFFAISTVINKFIMSPIVSVVFQQERKEGDFR